MLPILPPPTRGDCVNGPRPCPYANCRYHLDAEPSCALDVADDGARELAEVGALLGVSAQRVHQIERAAIAKLLESFGPRLLRELLNRPVPSEIDESEDDGAEHVEGEGKVVPRGYLTPKAVQTQDRVVALLKERGPMHQRDIAEAIGSLSDTKAALAALVHRGLLAPVSGWRQPRRLVETESEAEAT